MDWGFFERGLGDKITWKWGIKWGLRGLFLGIVCGSVVFCNNGGGWVYGNEGIGGVAST